VLDGSEMLEEPTQRERHAKEFELGSLCIATNPLGPNAESETRFLRLAVIMASVDESKRRPAL